MFEYSEFFLKISPKLPSNETTYKKLPIKPIQANQSIQNKNSKRKNFIKIYLIDNNFRN